MYRQLKGLLGDFAIYGIGQLLGKFVGLLLLPLYTRYLSPSDYGILSLLAMFAALVFVFINVGMSTGIFRFYLDREDSGHRDSVLFSSLVIMLAMSVPCLLIIVFRDPIALLLLDDSRWSGLLALATLTTYIDLLLKLPFSSMRALRQSKRYSTLNLFQTVAELLTTLVLVVVVGMGADGVVWGQFVGTALTAAYLLPQALLRMRFVWSVEVTRALLLFGLPLIPAGLANFGLTLVDRYLLKSYWDLHEVGLYSVGYRFGQVITFAVMAFQLAWPPFVFSNDKRADAGALFARVATYYFVGLGTVCLLLEVFAREIFRLVVGPDFQAAYSIVGLIALSQFFFGLYNITSAGILLKKKTTYTAALVGIAAAVNFALNLWLIPSWGITGAAWTTLFAYALLFWMNLRVSQQMYPIPFEYGRLARYCLIAVGIVAAARFVEVSSLWLSVAIKLGLVMLLPFLLVVTRFFEAREVAKARELLSKVRWFSALPDPGSPQSNSRESP